MTGKIDNGFVLHIYEKRLYIVKVYSQALGIMKHLNFSVHFPPTIRS